MSRATRVNYADPSGKFIQLLLPFALGGLIGAATSGFVAGRMWDMAHAGECGCTAQIWANGIDRNSFIAEEALKGAALGALFTGVVLLNPVAALGASAVSVAASGYNAFTAASDIMQNGANACNVLQFRLGILGVGLGALAGVAGSGMAGTSAALATDTGVVAVIAGAVDSTATSVAAGAAAGVITMSSADERQPVQEGEAGRFGDLDARARSGDDLTPHHMPQVAAGFTSREDGGAIVIPTELHRQTRTYAGNGARTNSAEAGLSFAERLQRDINDLRRLAGQYYGDSHYYDGGIGDLLNYYRLAFPEFDISTVR